MQELVKICPVGGTLLDPFCGGGSTLKAAKEIGRNVVGIDIMEQWCETSAHRCRQDLLALDAPPHDIEPPTTAPLFAA